MKDLRVLTSPEQVNYNMRFEGCEEDLVPVICVDGMNPGGILKAIKMVGYANDEAINKSIEIDLVTFYSRSKQRLWTKGEESGNTLEIRGIYTDCDADAVLMDVKPNGPTCHTDADSCFLLDGSDSAELADDEFDSVLMQGFWGGVTDIYKSVVAGKQGLSETYTQRTARDQNLIAKKIGEEASELVRAYTIGVRKNIAEEGADLVYRVVLLLAEAGVPPQQIFEILVERNKK